MTAIQEDLMKLYSQRILALAAGIPHIGRLEKPHGTAMKRSPLCGSTVTVDVRVEDGRIADFAQDVKACALGQSSASVLGAHVIGVVSTQEKRELALANGCEHVVLADQDVVAAVRELTHGEGVAAVYDSVGRATFIQAIISTSPVP